MTVEALMDLRKRVDERLLEHRADIQKQLERMDATIASPGGGRVARRGRRKSALKGRTVPPRYRGPSGETWAGRGAPPPKSVLASIRSPKSRQCSRRDRRGKSLGHAR
jgi:DNA-binding protein H-NS